MDRRRDTNFGVPSHPSGLDVLQLITTTDRRGAEVFGVDLGHALAERGWRVETVALTPGHDANGLQVPTLGPSRLGAATLAGLRRRSGRAHVVIAHGSTTLPAAAIALVGTGRPFVYRNIGDPDFWGRTWSHRTRSRVLLGRAAAVVALTDKTAQAIHDRYRVPTHKLRTIPKGIPASRFPVAGEPRRTAARQRWGLPRTGAVVLYLGALSPEKDVAAAVRAVGDLTDVHLLVVGGGPERAAIAGLGAAVAPGRVHVVGSTDEPSSALAAADVVVLPSRTEGLPGVLIEAAFTGLPVVATDVGWVREIVIPDRTGLLVPPDDPVALRAALARAIDHAEGFGDEARRHCLERFELSVVAAAWEELLREVAASGRP